MRKILAALLQIGLLLPLTNALENENIDHELDLAMLELENTEMEIEKNDDIQMEFDEDDDEYLAQNDELALSILNEEQVEILDEEDVMEVESERGCRNARCIRNVCIRRCGHNFACAHRCSTIQKNCQRGFTWRCKLTICHHRCLKLRAGVRPCRAGCQSRFVPKQRAPSPQAGGCSSVMCRICREGCGQWKGQRRQQCLAKCH